MVTDSETSVLPDTAVSINRKSGRFSDQKSASDFSLSKIGTSSQFAIVRIFRLLIKPVFPDTKKLPLLRQGLIHLPLIEKPFFRLKNSRVNHPDHFSIRPIHAEHPVAA